MKLITTVPKVLSVFAFFLALSLPAFAAKTPAAGADGSTCWWGDASFDNGCANASADANARANELAGLARAHKASLAAAASSSGAAPSGSLTYSKHATNGVGN